jgi:hypothetical protein
LKGWSGDKLPNLLTLMSIRDGLAGMRKSVARERYLKRAQGIVGAAANEGCRHRARQQDRADGLGHDG